MTRTDLREDIAGRKDRMKDIVRNTVKHSVKTQCETLS